MPSTSDLYQKRVKIQPRHVEGRFQSLRNYTRWLTLGIYFIVPWLHWNDKPVVLFDVTHRQFHILWVTFWPQDFFLLVLLLLIAALALFFFTALAGRLWCGYTCPQTVWTNIYLWIEYLTEGDRNQRVRLDNSRLSWNKLIRRLLKHSLWLGVAFLTALTFGGYFQSITGLLYKLFSLQLTGWDTFWIAFFTLATYLNAGWLREQVCMYMCPYARIQSVMFDQHTLCISYDKERGEQRGARSKQMDYRSQGLGDCIDCKQCVVVCPTGIDIRNGLQMECIGCAACVDACDGVMDKMGYPSGLVRYSTERSLAKQKTQIIRPRIVVYAVGLIFLSMFFIYLLLSRIPLRCDVIRDRNYLYRETSDGLIENAYTLKIMNMSQEPERYILSIDAPTGMQYRGAKNVVVPAGEMLNLPLSLATEPGSLNQTNTTIQFKIESDQNKNIAVKAESRFIMPERK